MKSENGRYRLLFILGLIWAVNSSLFARVTSVIEIAAGGGWSTLNYAVSSPIEGLNVRQNGSWSVTAHSEYIIMFNRYIGIGAGVDITHYGAITAIDGRMQWTGVTDTDGEVYNHHLSITGWRDKQDVWFLQPGLFIHADIPVGDNMAITFAGGGRYGLPIAQRMSYGGTTCHTGVYPQWGLTLYEMENHGFYTAITNAQRVDWTPNRMIDIVFRAGIEYQIGTYTALLLQGWVSCGLKNAFEKPSASYPLGFANDKEEMAQTHYFMDEYRSVLTTNLVTNTNSKPIAAGLEIGVRWIFPHPSKRTNICRCLNVYR